VIKKILLGLLIFVMLLLAGGYGYYRLAIYQPPLISEHDRAAINLMPLPAKLELKSGHVDLSKGFEVEYQGVTNAKITAAVARFTTRLNQKTGIELVSGSEIILTISCAQESDQEVQQAIEEESYKLTITKKQINLIARTPYGVLRGLETLLQLVVKRDGTWKIPLVEIVDVPRFPWRGLMLDVCRHWMPKDVVLRTIDAMATVKMNVFHWHLSEDQGFRVESKAFPKLHEIGSNGEYYTQDEIREVIQYAAKRGVRVVPEFDLPGHSKSWQIAYPELSSVDYPLEFGMKKGMAFAPPIDPAKESTYVFLDAFIGEMATLFPDPYMHIGGDEVNPKHWNENPSIQEFMQKNGIEDHHGLQAYFNKRMQAILSKHGKRMLGWDEILHPDLGSDIVVQSWRSHKSLFEAVQRGGTAILSSGYYLDLILPAGKHYGLDPLVLDGAVDIEPDTSFWKMYDLTLDIGGNEMQSQLVIFDRDPVNVFGYFAMMENRTAFKGGILSGDKLEIKFSGPVGEMNYEAEILNDSIAGKLSFGLLGFNASGAQTGGHEMPGTVMPEIEVMKPLTEDEKSRIIGGEACQWAEFVDSANVESRIWPRAAAIAEKLWSPQELTADTEDMYRRLQALSDQLTWQGSSHDTQYMSKLHELIPNAGFKDLKNLTDILEEVKYHSRMTALLDADSLYLPDFALDRIVDAVRPESLVARSFNQLVDRFMEENDTKLKKEIMGQLKIWQFNHELLTPYFDNSEKLQDVQNISHDLSVVSDGALALLDNRESNLSKEILLSKLSFLETGENGVVVAVTPGLRRIISER
jgi:hexosaminidase